ncbi:MAG: peptide deformylase [Actinomycetota bacterium]|nr:peptide deformylase [Actinomycetota bacterium]
MPVRQLITYPDQRVAQVAIEIDSIDQGVIDTAQDLIDTLSSTQGCLALSAPQIGVPLRMIAVSTKGAYIVVNPTISAKDAIVRVKERCFSYPGRVAEVERADRIFLRGVSIEGAQVAAEVTGLESRLIQHAVDHLDGIVI